jgi:hypothetical protein
MRAIVTVVMLDMWKPPKGTPKIGGIDVFDRFSTDVNSVHKSILLETTFRLSIDQIEKLALEMVSISGRKARVSRVEYID